MAKSIRLVHAETGVSKKGYVGFSWTYLFFGWFVPLFRGELTIALLHLVFSTITVFIWQLVAPFLYNKQFMLRQLEKGWRLDPADPNYPIAAEKLGMVS